jgi:hypothetical protein
MASPRLDPLKPPREGFASSPRWRARCDDKPSRRRSRRRRTRSVLGLIFRGSRHMRVLRVDRCAPMVSRRNIGGATAWAQACLDYRGRYAADEPDVEILFRQHFRRDLHGGRFTMSLPNPALPHFSASPMRRRVYRSFNPLRHQHAGDEWS